MQPCTTSTWTASALLDSCIGLRATMPGDVMLVCMYPILALPSLCGRFYLLISNSLLFICCRCLVCLIALLSLSFWLSFFASFFLFCLFVFLCCFLSSFRLAAPSISQANETATPERGRHCLRKDLRTKNVSWRTPA